MNLSARSYDVDTDFDVVSDFLYSLYEPNNADGNCFQPIWEYHYTHPYTDLGLMDRVRIWEYNGDLVGLAFFETEPVDAFFCVHPDYGWIKSSMLAYAGEHLTGRTRDGERVSRIYIADSDEEFLLLASSSNYERLPELDRVMSSLEIPSPFVDVSLPAGFVLTDMEETYDLEKMDRVLWRGFDHSGEPPDHGVKDRERMQSGPNYRKDLAVVVQAPTGEFASFCGMWYDPVNRFGYVEPVATDPDYRRLGLGQAAVLEGIRRCAALGATTAFVWVDTPFYRAIGFAPQYSHLCLQKRISPS